MIFTIVDLIQSKYSLTNSGKYIIIEAEPAVGVLHITRKSPYFIFGDVHLRGRKNGRYPYKYLEMIENLFGPEDNAIEVCSNDMSFPKAPITTVTVDINPANNPSIVDDGQVLSKVKDNSFNRWRCDPPYNTYTAGKMYGTELPSPFKLLEAGARVCKPGSLMFLLLGQNYQRCPEGVKRIGRIGMSIIPNNENRVLNIFYKE